MHIGNTFSSHRICHIVNVLNNITIWSTKRTFIFAYFGLNIKHNATTIGHCWSH